MCLLKIGFSVSAQKINGILWHVHRAVNSPEPAGVAFTGDMWGKLVNHAKMIAFYFYI